MSEALAGFIGALVGAIATIGTQGTLAWLDRRNAARTAARLLYGDLLGARRIMVASLKAGEWKTRRDLAYVGAAWATHREALARAVGSQGFHGVAGAFQAVELIQLVRERNAGTADLGFGIAKDRMPDAIERCDRARHILARASCTWWERYLTVRPGVESEELLEIEAEGSLPTRPGKTANPNR